MLAWLTINRAQGSKLSHLLNQELGKEIFSTKDLLELGFLMGIARGNFMSLLLKEEPSMLGGNTGPRYKSSSFR